MFKRIISCLLLAVSLFSLSGCQQMLDAVIISDSDYTPENNNKTNKLKIDKTQLDEDVELSPYYESIALKNGFNTLDTYSQQHCYLTIVENVEKFSDKTNKDGKYTSGLLNIPGCKLSERELSKVFEAVFMDNPQFFWVDETYSYSLNSDSVTLELHYLMSEEKYAKSRKQLNAVVNDILEDLKKNMTQFELELYLHDYLVKNCIYDKKAVKTLQGNSFNAYGALVQQKAVCQGYTDAFQLLLAYVGINSYKLSGTAGGENHIWNVVTIENGDYHIDVTWDDAKDFVMYDYFNLTTKQILKDHTISLVYDECTDAQVCGDDGEELLSYNIIEPNCKKTKYSYYVYRGCNVNSLEDSTISNALIEAAQNQEKIVHFYINPKHLDFDTVYNQLFTEENYGFVDYIYQANYSLDENKLSTGTYIAKKKKLHTVTVELKYQ